MSTRPLILSIDQGTTSTRSLLFDKDGRVHFIKQQELAQVYPQPGWVEHDPEAIWSATCDLVRSALQASDQSGHRIAAIGITNQRETTLVWDRHTGEPLCNAIVWQDRRTASQCRDLQQAGHEALVTNKTGLLLDPYFSATKIAWILDHLPRARQRAERGELAFGTIDSFLLWRLTGGRVHATDVTNASRTLLFDIHRLRWDEELLNLFRIPASLLPEVKPCSADFGNTSPGLFDRTLPICGIAGDQQSAAVGQACFRPGMIKSTYGTGCFVLAHTGEQAVSSRNRLLTTLAYQFDGAPRYALEGSIFVAGAAVQWLRDGLGLIEHAAETEALAGASEHNQGVYLVPAFTGLGAPHWDAEARGALFGLTRGTGVEAIVRATLESVAYQTHDLLKAMASDGLSPLDLRVDGGMVGNNWLCQFLADILDLQVERPCQRETTALGAAYIAGLQCGVYDSLDQIGQLWQQEARFLPTIDKPERTALLEGWQQAIQRVRSDFR